MGGLGAGAVAASGPALAAQQAVGDVALQTFNLPDGFVFAEMGIALGVMLLAFRLGATLQVKGLRLGYNACPWRAFYRGRGEMQSAARCRKVGRLICVRTFCFL